MIVSLILTIAIAFGSLVATLSLGWGPKLGLDLAGGLSVVYKPATHVSTADLQEVVTILNNRVNGLGVSGATVNLQGKTVVVALSRRDPRPSCVADSWVRPRSCCFSPRPHQVPSRRRRPRTYHRLGADLCQYLSSGPRPLWA